MHEKLTKLLTLATESPVENERRTAKKILDRLLVSCGLTVDDLKPKETKTRREFHFKSQMEYILFVQVACMVTEQNSVSVWKIRRKKRVYQIDLTDPEFFEIQFLYTEYLKDFHKQMKDKLEAFLQAFIHVNRIRPNIENTEKSNDPVDLEKIRRIIREMKGMEASRIYKRICE